MSPHSPGAHPCPPRLTTSPCKSQEGIPPNENHEVYESQLNADAKYFISMTHDIWFITVGYWSVQLFNYTIQSLYLRAESCSPCFCLLFLFWPPQFLIPPNSKLQNWHTWIPGYRLFSILPLAGTLHLGL